MLNLLDLVVLVLIKQALCLVACFSNIGVSVYGVMQSALFALLQL